MISIEADPEGKVVAVCVPSSRATPSNPVGLIKPSVTIKSGCSIAALPRNSHESDNAMASADDPWRRRISEVQEARRQSSTELSRSGQIGPTARSREDRSRKQAARCDSGQKVVSLRTQTLRPLRCESGAAVDRQPRQQDRNHNHGDAAARRPEFLPTSVQKIRQDDPALRAAFATLFHHRAREHAYCRRPSSFCSFDGRSWIVGLFGLAGSFFYRIF